MDIKSPKGPPKRRYERQQQQQNEQPQSHGGSSPREDLGGCDDMAIYMAAAISIGYDNGSGPSSSNETSHNAHATYNTKDGY
eukprot:scaffold76815_cov78-Attheya_sp.AAC.1